MNHTTVSLWEVYKDYFPIGTVINPFTMKTHRDLLFHHFNSITAENCMKFENLHPSENHYSFEDADKVIRIAREHNMKVRGHTLIWHRQTPEWVFKDKEGGYVSRQVLLQRVKEHIQNVFEHFKNDVYCWDAVNEAVAEGPEFLRQTEWLKIIGNDYVERIFEYAHSADPDVLLFYNDYDAINPEKRDKIIRLIGGLKQKGIPIHGIGLQGHWDIYYPSPEMIKQALDMYGEFGLQIQITELDVSLYAFDDKTKIDKPSMELLKKQEEFYEKIFSLFRQYRDIITGVTFWGIADDRTWLDWFPVRDRKNWPLLFDTEHQPKNAFFKIVDFS